MVTPRGHAVAADLAVQLLSGSHPSDFRLELPLNTEGLPTHSREEFCLALKALRERNGVALSEIESTTKIPAYLFVALERNDLSRWPKGLFRRAFFRDYARMIGLPVAEACAEFVRLFPDDDSVPSPPAKAVEVQEEEPPERGWVSDARRTGPPRIRVRIKVSK
jgi:cytoskeletal protein RodZ